MKVMIDLEMAGTYVGCRILTIGAVAIQGNQIADSFYVAIDPSALANAFIDDPEAMDWWEAQTMEAKHAAWGGSTQPDAALDIFSEWLASLGNKDELEVYGNGADFDIPPLVHYYRSFMKEIPWHYYNVRCYRTIKNLFPHITIEDNPNKHNALQDATYQARHLISLLDNLDALTYPPPVREGEW